MCDRHFDMAGNPRDPHQKTKNCLNWRPVEAAKEPLGVCDHESEPHLKDEFVTPCINWRPVEASAPMCRHKEINDEGICKACGAKASIRLPITQDREGRLADMRTVPVEAEAGQEKVEASAPAAPPSDRCPQCDDYTVCGHPYHNAPPTAIEPSAPPDISGEFCSVHGWAVDWDEVHKERFCKKCRAGEPPLNPPSQTSPTDAIEYRCTTVIKHEGVLQRCSLKHGHDGVCRYIPDAAIEEALRVVDHARKQMDRCMEAAADGHANISRGTLLDIQAGLDAILPILRRQQ